MARFDRITVEPGKMNGKPCIRGMRITVSHVLRLVSAYPSFPDIIAEFPELEDEDIRQALRFAADRLDSLQDSGKDAANVSDRPDE